MVRLDGVGLDYGAGRSKAVRAARPHLRDAGRRVPLAARPVRRRQDQPAAAAASRGAADAAGRLIAARHRHRRAPRRATCRRCAGASAWCSRISACCRISPPSTTSPCRCASPAGRRARSAPTSAEMLRWVGPGAQAGRPPGRTLRRRAAARRDRPRGGRPARSLLLADEPTGNLDEVQAERLMQLLQGDEPAGHHRGRRHPQRRAGRPPPRPRAAAATSGRLVATMASRARRAACCARRGSTISACAARSSDRLLPLLVARWRSWPPWRWPARSAPPRSRGTGSRAPARR